MSLLTDLISYWTLDEASGTRFDSHGSADLTPVNAPGSAAGIIGDALDLNAASSQYLVRASAIAVDLPVTISAWVHLDSGGSGAIFALSSSTTNRDTIGLFVDSGPTATGYCEQGSVSSIICGPVAVATGTWVHVVAVLDRGGSTLYLNGSAVTTAGSAPGITFSALDETLVGANDYSSIQNLFTGLIDEVGVWGVALTVTNIRDLYNGGAGLAYSAFGGGPSPITCTLSVTQASDTCAATATVAVSASLAQTQAADTLSATAAVGIGASLAVTQAADALSATAAVRVSASAAVAQAGDVLAGSAGVAIGAALSVTQTADTVHATCSTVVATAHTPAGVWRRSFATWARSWRPSTWDRAWRRPFATWARSWRYQQVSSTTRIPPATLAKTVSEERYFAVSFADCPEVQAGDTLTDAELIPPSVSGITIGAPTVSVAPFDGIGTGKGVLFLVTGGNPDAIYNFAVRATTSGGAKPVVGCRLAVSPDYSST